MLSRKVLLLFFLFFSCIYKILVSGFVGSGRYFHELQSIIFCFRLVGQLLRMEPFISFTGQQSPRRLQFGHDQRHVGQGQHGRPNRQRIIEFASNCVSKRQHQNVNQWQPLPFESLSFNIQRLTFYDVVEPGIQQLGERFVQLKCPVETLRRNQFHQFIVVSQTDDTAVIGRLPLPVPFLFIPSGHGAI